MISIAIVNDEKVIREQIKKLIEKSRPTVRLIHMLWEKICLRITDKKDKKAHGIGLSNIKNTALKYHGGVDWTVENKKFILTIMMQNERSTQNEYQ